MRRRGARAPHARRGRRRAARSGGGARVTVYLVGAGPGDPGLLTLRAVELIRSADVVLHDRLIPQEALEYARADAQLFYVGKQGGGPQMPQEEIDSLLVEHGRAGRRVVRLKGGDPLVFGRGGGPRVPRGGVGALRAGPGRAGRRVGGRKGGAPPVCGRGGEEAPVPREAGGAFEIAPALPPGVAAPAYAGIPVTHRELASAV